MHRTAILMLLIAANELYRSNNQSFQTSVKNLSKKVLVYNYPAGIKIVKDEDAK